MARAKKETKVVEERKFAAPSIESFDILVAPIVTEKTMKMQQEQNKITLKVKNTANKTQIKIAVQQIFNVKVVKVNVMNCLPKTKRMGRYVGKTNHVRKAIVTIAEGQEIKLFGE